MWSLTTRCMRKHPGSCGFESQLCSHIWVTLPTIFLFLPPPKQDDHDWLTPRLHVQWWTCWWCIHAKGWWHISSGISARKGHGHRTGRGTNSPVNFPPLGHTTLLPAFLTIHRGLPRSKLNIGAMLSTCMWKGTKYISCWWEVSDGQALAHVQHGLCKAVTNSLTLTSSRATLIELFPWINTTLSTSTDVAISLTQQTVRSCCSLVVRAVCEQFSTRGGKIDH